MNEPITGEMMEIYLWNLLKRAETGNTQKQQT